MYGNYYVPGKRPCGPKLQCMFKRPWVLTRDTTVHVHVHVYPANTCMLIIILSPTSAAVVTQRVLCADISLCGIALQVAYV